MKPEAVAWTDCPEEERERLEERGLVPCDREVFEIHQRTHGSEDE